MSLEFGFQTLCDLWPELAAFAGAPEARPLSSLAPGLAQERIASIRALARDATGLDATLVTRAADCFAHLFESGRWKKNPDVLSELGALLLREALVAESEPGAKETLDAWLTSLPRVLPPGREGRDSPDPRALELARDACQGLREQVDALADVVSVHALQAALLALAEHQAWLDALRPGSSLGPLGREALEQLLHARAIDALPDEIAEEADAEIARLRDALAKSSEPQPQDFPPDVLRDALRTELELTEGVWKLAGLPASGARFEVLAVPPGLESSIPNAAVFTARPLRPDEPSLVVVNAASPLLRDPGRRLLLAVHEGGPGHALQAARANAANRPWRAVDLCPIPGLGAGLFAGELMEGWAHFAEARYAELFPDDPLISRAVKREALWRAVRARADIGYARGELDANAAARLLVEKAGLTERDALAEVDDFRLNPTYGLSYFWGKRELRRLRAESKLPEAKLYARLLDEGLCPLALSGGGR
ncbi:MAG: DUF885 family protein [Deltaproteobacteria bacterium]|nr:DUF885 family protein [Deltaproteobacteria bacterium]